MNLSSHPKPEFSTQAFQTGSRARTGFWKVKGLTIPTPVFMPVGTLGDVKTLSFEEISEIGYQLILHNAYHLYLRPGLEILQHFGSINQLTSYQNALLTDSGGFQIFSLSAFAKVKADGIRMKDTISGQEHFFTPEKVIDIQKAIGSDFWMPLDHCTAIPSTYTASREALERTLAWAKRSQEYYQTLESSSLLFGIVQGNLYPDLRQQSIEELEKMNFAAYSIGGLSVGETPTLRYALTSLCTEHLPVEKPRYLMGVGTPVDIVESVHLGIDMFDCVLPTRNARHAKAFTHTGEINLRAAKFKTSSEPIDSACSCFVCKRYSRAYLHHLFRCKEILPMRLVSYHNLHYLYQLTQEIRDAIHQNTFVDWRAHFYSQYHLDIPVYSPEILTDSV